MLPKTRISTATARPRSSRNTRSISSIVRCGTSASAVLFVEGPDLDRERSCPRELPAPFKRRVQIRRIHNSEATDVLLAFDVRAIGQEGFSALCAHDSCGGGRMQAAAEYQRAGVFHFLAHEIHVAHDLLESVGRRGWTVGLIDAEQVLFHGV